MRSPFPNCLNSGRFCVDMLSGVMYNIQANADSGIGIIYEIERRVEWQRRRTF